MAQYVLRPAVFNDAERLGHIGVATFVESYTADIPGEAMMAHCTREHGQARYEDYLADPEASAWLAEHAETGAPIGYALVCPPDLPVPAEPGDLELKRIYVLSRFHGSGAGRALLEVAVEAARAAGAPRLLLGTYEANLRAVAFYRREGFEQVGTRQFNVGGRLFDDIVMARRL